MTTNNPRLAAARDAAANYTAFLQQRTLWNRWKYVTFRASEHKQAAKECKAAMDKALKVGGFSNITAALKYKRDNKQQQ